MSSRFYKIGDHLINLEKVDGFSVQGSNIWVYYVRGGAQTIEIKDKDGQPSSSAAEIVFDIMAADLSG